MVAAIGGAASATPKKKTVNPVIGQPAPVAGQVKAQPAPIGAPIGASGPQASTYAVPPPVTPATMPLAGGSLATAATPDNTPVGGTSSAYTPGMNQGTTDPVTGLLAQFGYSPTGLGTLYNNQPALAGDVLGMQGVTNQALANQLAQSFDPAVAANFILNQGKNSAQDNSTLNFVANALQQAATPGGRFFQWNTLMQHLLGAGSDPSQSPLAAYLLGGKDPGAQVNNTNNLIGQTLAGSDPYFQNAVAGYLGDLGNQYQGAMAKGGTYGSYLDYLNQTSGLPAWAR